MRITLFDEPVLRRKGKRVTEFDSALRGLVREMTDTMHEADGIGIAAQQVGEAVLVCIVDVRAFQGDFAFTLDGKEPPLDLIMPMALVNPEVEKLPGPNSVMEEGCLSFPGIRGDVKRPEAVLVRYQDHDGNPHTLECDGIFARCVQHEVDHLQGILFIDRMERKTARKLEPELKKLRGETRGQTAG